MRLLLRFGLAVLLTLSTAVGAQQLPASPYTVQLPVADTSVPARNQAFSDALAQVLARVAGGRDLRSESGYSDALKNAAGMVAEFHYQQAMDASAGMGLQVSFDPSSVRRLAQQLGSQPASRPPVVLSVRDAKGQLLAQSSLQSLADALSDGGYDVIYADEGNAPKADRLADDPAQLASISRHYGTGLILLGALDGTGGDWTLFSGGRAQSWHGTAANDALHAAGVVALSHIGQQLNVIGGGHHQGLLWVTGLGSAQDYASLLALLRDNSVISHVETQAGADDGILVQVDSQLPLVNLGAALAAGGRLQAAAAHPGADVALRWVH